jgi:hypothetical protein
VATRTVAAAAEHWEEMNGGARHGDGEGWPRVSTTGAFYMSQ